MTDSKGQKRRSARYTALLRWFDTSVEDPSKGSNQGIDWLRTIPFLLLHLGCLGILWVGWSPVALGIALFTYGIRMFAITGFYHRYFSHRTFRTSRPAQFVFALLGSAAVQRGPLWWAAHHRHHHRHSDDEEDAHSPHRRGFLWSHILWIMSRENFPTNMQAVKDLARYPELRFLNRFDALVPIVYAAGAYALGAILNTYAPHLGADGPQLLIWGFFVSTVALFHATSTINSLSHLVGSRRFETRDRSRNNPILALITLGEGWHNNHHYFPGAVRQGFYWWEIDLTYYALKLLSWIGLIWDLHPVPERVYAAAEAAKGRTP